METSPKDLAIGALIVLVAGSLFIYYNFSNYTKTHNITCANENIPYTSRTVDDPTLAIGKYNTSQLGINGAKEVCRNIKGVVTSEKPVSDPREQVISRGTYVQPIVIPSSSYIDSTDSFCPITTCWDNKCSESTGPGTCSWHGGIKFYN